MATTRTILRDSLLVNGRDPARAGMSVTIRGDRIESVEPDERVASSSDDVVHDLAGRAVMPGMVQSHFHSHFGAFGEGVTAPALGLEAAPPYLSMLAVANAERAVRCGFTGAIGSSNAHVIDVSLKDAIHSGLVRGPRYLAGSREIITTGEYSDYANNRNFFMQLGCTGLSHVADGPEAWRRAGRTEAGRGCDVVKISAGPGHGSSPARDVLYPTKDELTALVDAVHTLGKRVRAHAPSKTSILECARAGVDLIDHADRIDDECVEAILDNDVTIVPSMLWSERFLQLAESWDHDAQVLAINEGFPESPAEVRARISGVREDFEYTCEAMARAAGAGVRMVIGDDYGTPIMPHGDYVPEMELYVKRLGMTPLEVIRWATLNGAQAMGLGDEAGLVAPGRLADLVVVDGDPTADIAYLGDPDRILGVALGGDWIDDRISGVAAA